LDPNIDRANGRKGSWIEDEDIKLKYSVQMHGGKDWVAIAALVPVRTKRQCHDRWHDVLNPSIALTARRKGIWTEDEDIKLRYAIEMHGDKNWVAIAALVQSRTKKQCSDRWHNALKPSIDRTNERTGKWTDDEDIQLEYAVQTHDGKDWPAIAALVQGRTKTQCISRWRNVLDPSIDRSNGRTGKWTADEDIKLKAAGQTHGGKNWDAIAALCWFRVERKRSVGSDGNTRTLIVAQFGEKNSTLSIRRLLWHLILTALDPRQIQGLRYFQQVLYHRWHLWP
jgi:hypothetical protein